MVMNIGQRVTRLEETVKWISEVLDGFIENANHNAIVSNKNIERIQEGFEIVFKELDELKTVSTNAKAFKQNGVDSTDPLAMV